METTTLAVRQNEALAIVPGTETLERSDMVLPRLRLVQSQSTFTEADPGLLYNSLTGEAKPQVCAVMLKVGKARVMWPENFARDQDPLCASNDAVVPREEFVGAYSERCETCPMAEWQDNAPPPCSFGYTYLIADRDADDLPAILTATRTSLKAAKQANTLVRAFGVKREIVISSQQVVNERGKFFTLTFKLGTEIEPDNVARYAAMAQALGGVILSPDTGEENGAGEANDALEF